MKVEISYTFDASELGGQNLVTFEELYDLKNPEEPKKVAEHRLKLKYYFDVSDTREGKYKRLVRPVSLWSVSEEQQESVKEALVNAFGVADGDRKEFAMVILEASLNIAEDNIGDYLQDILLATKDSPLEEMDEFNIRLKMKQLLANSISYMLFFSLWN